MEGFGAGSGACQKPAPAFCRRLEKRVHLYQSSDLCHISWKEACPAWISFSRSIRPEGISEGNVSVGVVVAVGVSTSVIVTVAVGVSVGVCVSVSVDEGARVSVWVIVGVSVDV